MNVQKVIGASGTNRRFVVAVGAALTAGLITLSSANYIRNKHDVSIKAAENRVISSADLNAEQIVNLKDLIAFKYNGDVFREIDAYNNIAKNIAAGKSYSKTLKDQVKLFAEHNKLLTEAKEKEKVADDARVEAESKTRSAAETAIETLIK